MTKPETISVQAPGELIADLRAAVAKGAHASLDDLVREALDEWHARWALQHTPADKLAALWQEGLASGGGEPLDMSAIKQKARALHKAG
jgi:Arc/MetJ-type ribon-helix-helix transcriptional regulator